MLHKIQNIAPDLHLSSKLKPTSTLNYPKSSYWVQTHLTYRKKSNPDVDLESPQIQNHVDSRFCFAPLCRSGVCPMTLENRLWFRVAIDDRKALA